MQIITPNFWWVKCPMCSRAGALRHLPVPRLRTHGFVASDRPQPRFDSGRNGSNGGVKLPFGATINGDMHGDISNNMRTYGNIIGYSGI